MTTTTGDSSSMLMLNRQIRTRVDIIIIITSRHNQINVLEKECECYEEKVQPYRKTDYKPIIYILCYRINIIMFLSNNKTRL